MTERRIHYYNAYGLVIASEMLLPELTPVKPVPEPDVTIRKDALKDKPLTEVAEGHYCEATEQEAHLYFPASGNYKMIAGKEILVEGNPGVSDQVLRLFIIGACLGVILHQRGKLTLHASAVASAGSGCVFVGWKGAGKSTTAAAMNARGFPLIADDLVAVDFKDGKPVLLPGFPQFKLWPDAAAASFGDEPGTLPRLHPEFEKRARSAQDSFHGAALPFEVLYVLDRGDAFAVEPLDVKDGFHELLRHSYAVRFLGKSGANRTYFDQVVALSKSVSVRRIRRPRDLGRLSELAALVAADLQEGTPATRETDAAIVESVQQGSH